MQVARCNLVACGVGITPTAGTHVVFQNFDWVPANHLRAEDRTCRLGQKEKVTGKYFYAEDTPDGYVAILVESELKRVSAVQAQEASGEHLLQELYSAVNRLAPSKIPLVDAALVRHAKRAEAFARQIPFAASQPQWLIRVADRFFARASFAPICHTDAI